MEVLTFTCSICGESSRDICLSCTKDTCANHLCERCKRCSDCCVCEVRLITQHETNGRVPHFIPLEEPELPKDVPADVITPNESHQV